MDDEAYLDAAGNRCLTTILKALKGNLDGPAIGDAMMRNRDGMGYTEKEDGNLNRVSSGLSGVIIW